MRRRRPSDFGESNFLVATHSRLAQQGYGVRFENSLRVFKPRLAALINRPPAGLPSVQAETKGWKREDCRVAGVVSRCHGSVALGSQDAISKVSGGWASIL